MRPSHLAPTTSTPVTALQAGVRPLMLFFAAALGVGGTLIALSTLIEPEAPFLLAAVLLGLAAPALILTYRESGQSGVTALLRGCVTLPKRWWWLLLAAFGLPMLVWTAGAALGGAQPLTWPLIGYYIGDLFVEPSLSTSGRSWPGPASLNAAR